MSNPLRDLAVGVERAVAVQPLADQRGAVAGLLEPGREDVARGASSRTSRRGRSCPSTPWLWAYWPVMKVARAGQQSGKESTASANVVPCRRAAAGRSACTATSAAAMSSVITTRMFGRPSRSAARGGPRAGGAGRTAERPSASDGERAGDRSGPSRRPTRTYRVTLCQPVYDPRRAHRAAAERPDRRIRQESRERIVAAATELVRRRPTARSASTRSCARPASAARSSTATSTTSPTSSCAPAARRSRSSTRPSAALGEARIGDGAGASARRSSRAVAVYERHGPLLRAIAEAAAGDEQSPPARRPCAGASTSSSSRRCAAPCRQPRRPPTLAETARALNLHERELPARRVRPRAARVRRDRGADPDRDLGRGHRAAERTEATMDVFRTPDERFEDLPGFDYEPHYVEVDGLRLHHLDEGAGPTSLLPRRAELELPLPAHARRAGRERPPRRRAPTSSASAAPTSRPTRAGTPTSATSSTVTRHLDAARPRGRHRRRPGLGRPDRAALGRRARRPGRAARDPEHRPLHRPGEQGLHGLARLRRAHSRPADRQDHPGRDHDRPAARGGRRLRGAFPSPRARRARSASRCWSR